jgi:hypothetical protein
MVRGPKKHMKRLNAPKHWMLDKLGGVFVRGKLFPLLLCSILWLQTILVPLNWRL